ncbi:dihydroorotate dehydrogenase electron transfer subunit [Salicibibacter cibarius]|uniref:Dihydroorotate dehydrogenase B (NAD(+)), electron transfer subunit n=1 Tax=Salicibibacter cibarius TaxID=2743000 RepID=A0A7T7CC97_9BACI|nr:dihydroorotate dehydrogenase electron transfer subunit [Salicibibacter cibarius]QQK76713.1 dihydroorotate dehydrogenase electron transfer subunit [Salicibibacter cibarius]
MKNEQMTVRENKTIAEKTYEMTLSGPLVEHLVNPGTFLHVAVPGDDLVLRRPISIAAVDQDAGTCTIVYKEEGEGTKRLSRCRAGDSVDVFGPLGKQGFPAEQPSPGDDVLIIGGGVGVPPLYYTARELAKRDVSVSVILGFQTATAVFYEQAFRELPDADVRVMTDDGSNGHAGTVIDALNERPSPPDWLFACGPRGMLRAIEAHAAHSKTNGYVSLEERMGCGIGACFACVCETGDHTSYRKICRDGPVFRFKEVVL